MNFGGRRLVGGAPRAKRGESSHRGVVDRQYGDHEARGREPDGGRVRGLRYLWAPAFRAIPYGIQVRVERHEGGHEDHERDQTCTVPRGHVGRIIPITWRVLRSFRAG